MNDKKNTKQYYNFFEEKSGESTLIVCGGLIQEDFAQRYIANHQFKNIIGVDKGIEFLDKIKIMPTHILGDFDSISKKVFEKYENDFNIIKKTFNPIKDESDSELAIKYAIELKSKSIHILGATGKRIDHSIANIRCLNLPLKQDIPCVIVDENNEIRLINKNIVLKKEKINGKYVSLFPFDERIKNLSINGFKYELNNKTIKDEISLTLSNELVENEGYISFEDSVLILIISRD